MREHGEVCPAGWKPGGDTMVADPNKSMEYFAKQVRCSVDKRPETSGAKDGEHHVGRTQQENRELCDAI